MGNWSKAKKLDCPKAEDDGTGVCRLCGRPVKQTHLGKTHHRRGYKRVPGYPKRVPPCSTSSGGANTVQT